MAADVTLSDLSTKALLRLVLNRLDGLDAKMEFIMDGQEQLKQDLQTIAAGVATIADRYTTAASVNIAKALSDAKSAWDASKAASDAAAAQAAESAWNDAHASAQKIIDALAANTTIPTSPTDSTPVSSPADPATLAPVVTSDPTPAAPPADGGAAADGSQMKTGTAEQQ